MKFFRKLTLIALAAAPLLAQDSQQGQTPQREFGVVRGTVRAETGELITGAELTLSVEPPLSLVDSLKSIASSMGFPPGEAQAVLAQMMRQTPELLERQLAQLKATGNSPAALVDVFSQLLAVRTIAKGFPLRAISDGNGEFTFTGVPLSFWFRHLLEDGILHFIWLPQATLTDDSRFEASNRESTSCSHGRARRRVRGRTRSSLPDMSLRAARFPSHRPCRRRWRSPPRVLRREMNHAKPTETGFRYRAIPCEGRLKVLRFRASPIINWVIFRVRESMP